MSIKCCTMSRQRLSAKPQLVVSVTARSSDLEITMLEMVEGRAMSSKHQ